jgi:hypothetical protein
MEEILLSAGMGILGAITKEIIVDNKLVLPKNVNGELCLGFLGGIIIGGLAGYAVDGNPITAFLGGYSGKSIIEALVTKNGIAKVLGSTGEPANTATTGEDVATMIRRIATEEKVDPELAFRVAKCESNLNPKAIGTNTDGSRDRGLYQINDKWHPDVTDDQAFDAEFSIRFFCKAIREGHLSWWDASKSCWNT